MRNLLKPIFLFAILFTIGSCSNEVNENEAMNTENSELQFDLKKVTEDFNSKEHRDIPAKFIEGNIDFGISEENLVVLVGNEGKYKTSFVIQLDKNQISGLRSLKSGKFEVAYLVSELVLTNGDKTLYFTFEDDPVHKEIALNSKVIKAIGIANWTNEALNMSSSKEMAFKLVDDGATCTCKSVQEPQQICGSGGSGSSSCSQGSNCSVSCKTGYYACCNE